MKFKRLFAVLALAIGALSSCGPTTTDPNGKVIPTYTGMGLFSGSISEETSEPLPINPSVKKAIDNGNHYGHDKHGNDKGHKEDNTIEEEAEDLVDLTISDTSITEYYVDLEEDFIVTINFNNPDQFEIISFTLNGKVYQNNMFEDGSDLSTIYIEWKGFENPGYHDLTIDAVKYIDGTEIKNARYEGDRTIKVGVEYDKGPKVNNFVGVEVYEEFAYAVNFDFEDPYEVIEKEGDVIFVVSDGENIIYQENVVVGNNSYSVTNIFPNTMYQYSIMAKYDNADGNNQQIHVLEKGTFNLNQLFDLQVVGSTNDSITVKASSTSYVKIEELCIHEDTEETQEIETILYQSGVEEYKFENLYSNFNYYVGIVYTFEVDGATYFSTAHLPASTSSNVAPTLTLKQNKISFNNVMVDVILSNKEFIKSSSISIYEVGVVDAKETIESPNGTVKFNNLNSNTEYKVVASVIYNLNDSKGDIEITEELTMRTLEKSKPSIEISDVSAQYNKISFNASIRDSHKTGISYRYEMIQLSKNEVVKEGNIVAGVNKVENLFAGNTYKFNVYMKYKLDTNEPELEELVTTFEATTTALALPIAQFINIDVGYQHISFGVDIKDPSNVIKSKLLKVYDFDKDVKTEIYSTEKIEEVNKLINLKTNHQYIIELIATYDLSDGNGVQELVINEVLTTLQHSPVTISYDVYSVTQHSIEGYVTFNNQDKFTLERYVTLYKATGDSIENIEIVQAEQIELEFDYGTWSFDNLLSNNLYVVEFSTKVDYQDGNGVQDIVERHLFSTVAYVTPTLDVELYGIDETSAKVRYSFEDIDNRLTSVKFELFRIDENGEKTFVYEQKLYSGINILSNLTPGAEYQYVLTYSYDLNDGVGVQEVVKEYDSFKIPTDEVVDPEEPIIPDEPGETEEPKDPVEPGEPQEPVDPENPIDPNEGEEGGEGESSETSNEPETDGSEEDNNTEDESQKDDSSES